MITNKEGRGGGMKGEIYAAAIKSHKRVYTLLYFPRIRKEISFFLQVNNNNKRKRTSFYFKRGMLNDNFCLSKESGIKNRFLFFKNNFINKLSCFII